MTNKPINILFNAGNFQKEVEAHLKKVDNPRFAAAFAARVALATLPMLAVPRGTGQAAGKFLWYWEKDRERHLFAVCRALQVAWSLTPDVAIISSIADAEATRATRAAEATRVARAAEAAAYAVADAARAARAARADATAYTAAYTAAYAAVAASAPRVDNNLIP